MTSPDPNHFDLIALGSGEAGKILAWTYASAQKKRCAVIERSMLGGSCPNVACLPSKNVLYSAKVAHLAQNGSAYGVKTPSTDPVVMKAVKARKDEMVSIMRDVHLAEFRQAGAELIWGEGRFVAPKAIEITGQDGQKRTTTADVVIVNTGSRARIPMEISGLQEAKPLTHVEVLNLDQVPDHLVVLGGGYVGVEFAQASRRFGARVTVIERNSRIIKDEDEDVSSQLQEVLEKEGVEFHFTTTITSVSGTSGRGVTLHCDKRGHAFELQASHFLCATGRLPNTADIGLKLAGIEVTSKGHVLVDEQNRATAEGVFAVGDCAGSPHFTHIGFDDFRIVRDVLAGKSLAPDRRTGRQIPFTLFTDPEVAHCGLREHEAKARGVKYRLAKVDLGVFLRTYTLEEGAGVGFAKALVSTENDTVLGFTAVGPGAGELLPVVQLVMKKGLPYADIANLIVAHPTMNEGLVALFGSVSSN